MHGNTGCLESKVIDNDIIKYVRFIIFYKVQFSPRVTDENLTSPTYTFRCFLWKLMAGNTKHKKILIEWNTSSPVPNDTVWLVASIANACDFWITAIDNQLLKYFKVLIWKPVPLLTAMVVWWLRALKSARWRFLPEQWCHTYKWQPPSRAVHAIPSRESWTERDWLWLKIFHIFKIYVYKLLSVPKTPLPVLKCSCAIHLPSSNVLVKLLPSNLPRFSQF